MADRSVKDRLRDQYFDLLPDIRRVAAQLEAEVRYFVLPITRKVAKHEQVVVTSRIKECESAVDALRRRQEGGTFDPSQVETYTLTSLNDLAGVRVLAFPRSRLTEINQELRDKFPSWKPDPVPGLNENDEPLALKYHGYCEASSQEIRGEYQIVSMLIGRFWEVEHSTPYKPTPELKGIAGSRRMRQCNQEVIEALRTFEETFEDLIKHDPLTKEQENDTRP